MMQEVQKGEKDDCDGTPEMGVDVDRLVVPVVPNAVPTLGICVMLERRLFLCCS